MMAAPPTSENPPFDRLNLTSRPPAARMPAGLSAHVHRRCQKKLCRTAASVATSVAGTTAIPNRPTSSHSTAVWTP